MNYSVAHWEGDTLIVDTRGFNDKVYVGTNNGSFTGGFKHSPKLHRVERLTRINYGTLEVDVMLEDPQSLRLAVAVGLATPPSFRVQPD